MLSLNLKNELICFKNIRPEDLSQVLVWYNKVDDFKYATGIDKPITLNTLTRKYAEVAICGSEFFVGIYLCNHHQMIGILKGSLNHTNRESAWISSIVIDPAFQKRGLGCMAVQLLLNYLISYGTKNVLLAVIEENLQGIAFWDKMGFEEVRRIENHLSLQNKRYNVVIMNKKIGITNG